MPRKLEPLPPLCRLESQRVAWGMKNSESGIHPASRIHHTDEEKWGQASRPISTGKLNPSRDLHLRPINLVVFEGP